MFAMHLATKKFSPGREITKEDTIIIEERLVDCNPIISDDNPEEKQKEDRHKFEEHIASIVKRVVP